MPLTPGTKLGPYEVLAPAGAGGMGEVYRARDTRLDRTVAIKVLSARLAGRPDLQKRFEREARTISKLTHPHICALYDVGQQEGLDFLVMEYLEGETLSHRLQRGPLLVEQTLKYGIEITEALEAAHRQGIIHRDLKPGNVMLTKSGAKLMDFGLAKLAEQPAPVAVALSEMATAPTLPSQEKSLTEEGVIVGTFQYMAPEQLEGKDADARTDIFALGMVLYEMATGRPAFTGRTKASVIAAILSSEPPPISSLQPLTPPAFDRAVKTCLAKDPEERFSTAHDLKLQLKWIAEGGSEAGIPAPVVVRRRHRERVAWACVAVLTLIALVLGIAYVRRTPPSPMVVRFIVPFPENTRVPEVAAPHLSPDGRMLAFGAERVVGKPQIWVRSLDSLALRELPGTEGTTPGFFWSPDGKWIGFFVEDKLKRAFLSGGSVETLCTGMPFDPYGAEANSNGTLLAFFESQPIQRISLDDCSIKPATRVDRSGNEVGHGAPHFLPDGKHFLFTSIAADRRHRVLLGSLDSMEAAPLLLNASHAYYVEPGYIVFSRQGNLLAQPFDLRTLRASGEAFRVVYEKAFFYEIYGYADYSASVNGVLAYMPEPNRTTELVWMDRAGKRLETILEGQSLESVRLSPDGRRIVTQRYDAETHAGDLWTYDLKGRTWTQVTFRRAPGGSAALWSADGNQVIYGAYPQAKAALFRRPSQPEGSEELLLQGGDSDITPTDVSPDGKLLLYEAYQAQTTNMGYDLILLPLEGTHTPQPFLASPSAERGGHFSPDGRWVVYSSDETGRPEIYLRPFSSPNPKLRVTQDGGTWPVWRRDGKELFYLSLDKKVMSVSVQLGPVPKAGPPQALFPTDKDTADFAVSADGRRFLLTQPAGTSQATLPIRVVVNWTAELQNKK